MAKKSNKRVCDYSVDYSSGLFTCCEEHIMQDERDAFEGMTIECEHCNTEMILQNKNGVLVWVGK